MEWKRIGSSFYGPVGLVHRKTRNSWRKVFHGVVKWEDWILSNGPDGHLWYCVLVYVTGRQLRTLLIGDSIVRGVERWVKVSSVRCYPGATLRDLGRRVFQNEVATQFDVIVIHGGTNDIERRSVAEIVQEFKDIVTGFRESSQGHIGFSCILPRPRDELHSRDKVFQVNNELMSWCAKNGCICLRTFGPFSKSGWSRRELFKRDLLHPAEFRRWGCQVTGQEVLGSFLNTQLASKVLIPRVQALERLRFV